MNTCETCRHWKRERVRTIGACGAMSMTPMSADGLRVLVAPLITARDGNRALTMHDFGCVAHEPRASKPHPDWRLT